MLASAAEGFWLMEAPVSRRRLLGRRLLAAVLIALVSGAVLGALVATLTGSAPGAIVAWTLACGLGAGGLTALAAAEQGAERTWLVKLIHSVMALAAMAALLLVVATAAGWLHPVLGRDVTELLALVVAGIGLVMLIASSIIANHRIDRIRRARLVAGGNLVSGMQGAAFALDFALMRDILVTREANERGHVKPTRGRSTGLQALVMRDVQRLHRFPRPLLTLLASAIVPYAMQALGLGRLTIPISALVLLAALVPFMNSLRVLTRTKGLQRCLPFDPSQIKQAAMIVPAVLALLWTVGVFPAFLGVAGGVESDPVTAASSALVTGVAGLLAAVRWVSAKPADYSGPIVSTGIGAMPPGLLFSLLRGVDIVVLVTLPIVFNWPVWVSLIIALIAFMLLRSGLDLSLIHI